MSRIGKRPLSLPENVKLEIGDMIQISGPKGSLMLAKNPLIKIDIEGSTIYVKRGNDSKQTRSLHGLYRSLLQNMIEGVNKGFEIKLELKGVGYRVAKQGEGLTLNLGYSHPITIESKTGIEFQVEKNTISIKGIDKQLVGETAALIRKNRPPEPYKGKGIRYVGEKVRMKAGKAAKAAGK